ncbi:hypothetical protein ACO1O0_008467 [Amphichorda felina]
MPALSQIYSVLAAGAVVSVNAAMGPAFSTGPVADGSWIREATSTLILPETPRGTSGISSLWVGMGTSNGDLIQSIADNWESSDWDIFAYTLVKTGDKFDDASGNYTQTVSVNDEVVSTLSTSSGEAQGWGSAVECAENNCGTMPAHSWEETKIILDSADPNYINTNYKGEGVTGDMSTSDGGKTWVVTTIDIPEFTFA